MKKSVVLFAVMMFAVGLFGSELAGTAGMQFLKIGADARGNSLSGAVIGEVSGVDSIYWNPAGMSSMRMKEAIMTYNSWVGGMTYLYAGFGMPLLISKFGKVGGSITFLSEGDVEETAGNISDLSSLSSYDLAISGAYGMRIGKIQAGGAIRFITKSIFGERSTGAVMDIGGQMEMPGITGLKAGMVAKNLGFASAVGDKPENMPMMYQVGISYKYEQKENSITGLVSSDIMVDDLPYVNIGAEYGYREAVYVRVGYRVETGGNALGGAKGLSVGIGGRIENMIPVVKGMRADVTWIPMADLGNIMQLTFTVGF